MGPEREQLGSGDEVEHEKEVWKDDLDFLDRPICEWETNVIEVREAYDERFKKTKASTDWEEEGRLFAQEAGQVYEQISEEQWKKILQSVDQKFSDLQKEHPKLFVAKQCCGEYLCDLTRLIRAQRRLNHSDEPVAFVTFSGKTAPWNGKYSDVGNVGNKISRVFQPKETIDLDEIYNAPEVEV